MSGNDTKEQPPSAKDAMEWVQRRTAMENSFYLRGLYFLLAQVVLVINYSCVVAVYERIDGVLLPKALVAILGVMLSVFWCLLSRTQASRYGRVIGEIERAARESGILSDKWRALPSGFAAAVFVPVYVFPVCALVFWFLVVYAACFWP